MKKYLALILAFVLAIALFAGCGTAPNVETNATEAPTSNPATEATEATEAPTEVDEAALQNYYTKEVYADQISRYHLALYQQWEIDAYFENEMSTMPIYYYEGEPLDNVGYGFADLDKDGNWELVIGAIQNAELDPAVIEIWTLVDGVPVMLAQGGSGNSYVLRHTPEGVWHIVHAASNNVASQAVYVLSLVNGKLEVVEGVVFDALANEQDPWFKTADWDWDVANDQPIDGATAEALQSSYREYCMALGYVPYISY